MANYGVNIDVKVKAGQLTNFNRVLDKTNDRIRAANKNIQRFASLSPKHIKPVSQSYNDLTMMVNKANKAFNESTLGTPQAVDAAKNLVKANEQLNLGLEKKAKLLQQVTLELKNQKLAEKGIKPGTMFSGPIGPGQATSMFRGKVEANVARSREIREIAAAGSNRQGLGGGFKEFNKNVKKIQADTKKMSGTLAQLSAGEFAMTAPFGVKGGNIGPALPPTSGIFSRLGFGRNANPKGLFAMQGGASARLNGGIGSALIGGGFPALFGAGGISSAFGAIAGGAGGALAPGGGFAASIFATAIASQIEKTIAFNKAVDDLNVSIKATGGTSLFTAKQVKEFASSLGLSKDEALEALKAFKQFEAAARVSLLKFFGSEAIFDTFAGLKDNASIINALPGLSKELRLEQAKIALETLKTNGASAAELKLRELIFDKNTEILKQERKKENFFGISKDIGLGTLLNPFRGLEFGKGEGNFFQQLKEGTLITTKTIEEIKKSRVEGFFDSEKFKEELENAKERLRIQKEFNEELERQAIIKAPVDELNKLLDPLTQIDSLSRSIGDAFAESFKGLIKGTMSVGDAFRNLFMRITDSFLDMAAQILAAQIRAGIMGLFANLFKPFDPTFGTGIPSGKNLPPGSFNITPKANGGPVTGGRSYLVGERGPEMFTPGVSGGITPNHALGGSTNVTVNVDASGSNVEGDAGQAEQLGEAISQAIQAELIQQKRPGGILYN